MMMWAETITKNENINKNSTVSSHDYSQNKGNYVGRLL